MTDKIWQCCFTNTDHINGVAVSSGWTGLAVSESIPNAAREACMKWQAANSRIENESAALNNNVYELICDNEYAFVIKNRYGLKDNHGRPNMFSHAYIAPMEEFLKDPNCLLALSEVNFADNQEEAEKRKHEQSTAASLIYNKSFEIASALELLSMEKEKYKTLLRTVYILNADERNLRPLHIEAYEDNEKSKALIYLIHIGLPYHIRTNLKVAIMPQTDAYYRNILFDKEAKSRGVYIVPESGENNNKAQASPVFELIDEFAEHYDLEEKDLYYKDLSDKALGLGGKGVLTERALKIAYAMNNIGDVKEKSEWDDEKLMLRLSDALLYNADMITSHEYREEFEDFVASMLDEVMERRLGINENMYERIAGFTIKAASKALQTTCKKCRQYRFETAMNEEQKRAWLENLDTNALGAFIEFSCDLIKQKRNYTVLKEYLISDIEKSRNVEELLKVEAKILRIEMDIEDKETRGDVFKDMHKVLIDKLWELYNANINSADVKTMYDTALEVYKLLATSDESINAEEAKFKAKKYFWQAFSFEKMERLGTDADLYSFMSLPEDDNYQLYTGFINILNKIPQQKDIYESLKELNIYCIQNAERFVKKEGYKEKKLIENIFIKHLARDMKKDVEFADGFVEDMVTIATEVREYSLYEEFIYIIKNVNGVKEADYKLLDTLSLHIEEGELKVNTRLRKSMFKRIHEKFRDIELYDEEEDSVVRLDSWLALGKIYYSNLGENWFEVFDDNEYKAKVLLDKDIEELLDDSYYFVKCENDIEKGNCLNAAVYYVENKGRHKSVINKWVKYIERLDKEPSGGIGDFFGKLFGKKREE